jgi:hypothetical protein
MSASSFASHSRPLALDVAVDAREVAGHVQSSPSWANFSARSSAVSGSAMRAGCCAPLAGTRHWRRACDLADGLHSALCSGMVLATSSPAPPLTTPSGERQCRQRDSRDA